MDNVALFRPGRMTEAEYERERAALRATYGDNAKEASAKRDQALAALLVASRWTQDELAKKEGKPQNWVSRHSLFGRFLEFIPMGINAENLPKNLTERRFRSYWDRTEGNNERQRFVQVQRLMAEDITLRAQGRPKIGAALIEHFADGKWHSIEVMAKKLGSTPEHVKDTLDGLRKTTTHERKQVGKSFSYRIFTKARMISTEVLTTKLGPIIDGLKVEGKKNMATMSPNTVAYLAGQLQNLLDTWAKEPH